MVTLSILMFGQVVTLQVPLNTHAIPEVAPAAGCKRKQESREVELLAEGVTENAVTPVAVSITVLEHEELAPNAVPELLGVPAPMMVMPLPEMVTPVFQIHVPAGSVTVPPSAVALMAF